MHHPTRTLKLLAAAGAFLFSASVFSAPNAFVEEGFKEAQSSMNKVSDSAVEQIKSLVNEAEASLQITLDDLTEKKETFGKDWNNIEEGFVYYSRTEADYLRALLEHQESLCRALGKGDCAKIAETAVLNDAKDMLDRAQLIRKVALKQPVPDFSLRLTEDKEGPVNRAIRRTLTSEEAKNSSLETTRLFLRLKMTYLGLLEQLSLSNKEDYRAKMIEHEMVRQDSKRAEEVNRLWAVTGKEAIAPRPIGEKRRAAMLQEFDIQ